MIGRLAVSLTAQGYGVGKMLLVDAIKRTFAVSEQIAIYAMIVDAIDDNARAFYEQFGFIRLAKEGRRLFLQSFHQGKCEIQYVEQRPHEHVSIALPFGSAIHSVIERYYRSLKDNGILDQLWQIQDCFEDHLTADLDTRNIPILWKKETPDTKSAIEMGKGLLKAFYEGNDITGYEVAGIELPLMCGNCQFRKACQAW